MLAARAAMAQTAPCGDHALHLEYCASCHGTNIEGQPDWMQRLPNGPVGAAT